MAAIHPIQPLGPTPMNDRFGEAVPLVGTTAMAKVFGRRPSQVEREARGRRTETSQARTRGAQVRRYGDLRILVQLFRRRARFTSAARW